MVRSADPSPPLPLLPTHVLALADGLVGEEEVEGHLVGDGPALWPRLLLGHVVAGELGGEEHARVRHELFQELLQAQQRRGRAQALSGGNVSRAGPSDGAAQGLPAHGLRAPDWPRTPAGSAPTSLLSSDVVLSASCHTEVVLLMLRPAPDLHRPRAAYLSMLASFCCRGSGLGGRAQPASRGLRLG